MRVFIAEKPELAKAIVTGLGGGEKVGRGSIGYYKCGDDMVTWCFGHMLTLMDPEDYDEKYKIWNMNDLPWANIPWRKKPGGDKDEQLSVILDLLSKASSVVHAGDPDDEGQLLVDEILEYANCNLPTKRVLISAFTDQVVKKALANMRDNSEFKGLSDAAEARSVGDQLYGYNITRAYTLAAQAKGYQGVLSVGRVQTPVLGLIVRRTRAFKAHEKTYYFNVNGEFEIDSVKFPARYIIKEGDPVDEKGRLSNQAHAEQLAAAIKGKPARLAGATTSKKQQQPPLPYNLLKLQGDASRKFGFKPDFVKDVTQALREKHKLITYNRSDCQYLDESQHEEAPGVIAAIAATAPALAAAANRADPKLKSRAFDSKKVSAHHGIIPTDTVADLSRLSDSEQKIYLLVARQYLAQFWPNRQYDQTTLEVVVEADGDGQPAVHAFKVRSNVDTAPGWKVLYTNDGATAEEDEEGEDDVRVDFRSLKKGAQGKCYDSEAAHMETKPQPLYTMETLLNDLTRVAKYVKSDRLRALLIEKDKGKEGEHGGIGTPATRDQIMATLFERGFIVEDNKKIISTPTGEDLYDSLPDQARFPDMTALWHEQQLSIQEGKLSALDFINGLMKYIGGEVETVKTKGLNLKVKATPCPTCKKGFLRRFPRSKGEGFFWSCTRYKDETNPCTASFDDKGGKPVPRAPVVVSTQFKCKACGKGLIRRPGAKRPGKAATPFWGCSGYPECNEKYADLKGRPVLDQK